MPKLKKKSEAQKKKLERERNVQRRQDKERRDAEQAADTQARRVTRQSQQRREAEQAADTQARRVTRQSQQRREAEQAADTQARRVTRQSQERREAEQAANTEARQVTRQSQERREAEQAANTQGRRVTRQSQQRREAEQAADTQARRVTRQSQERREAEQAANTEARQVTRQSRQRREAEQATNTKQKGIKRKMGNSTYDSLFEIYSSQIRMAPSFICSCCGGLFYEDSTTPTSEEILQSKGLPEEFITNVLFVDQASHRLCGTCKKYVYDNANPRVPRVALSNGLNFPVIPLELQDMSPLEERLVALRIPFMQIRLRGSQRQSVLHGNVVNVENDLDVCAEVLPRKFNETSTVQVQLMRRMSYSSPYMYETIRPLKVYKAAKYLTSMELYTSQNVLLSEDWSGYEDEDTINFICSNDDDDMISGPNLPEDVESNHPSESEDVQNMGAEETLLFNEKDAVFTGIKIAPGEGRTPVPLYRDPKAEMSSFPTIYCGVDRTLKPGIKLSYTDIAKSELRRYDRRACIPAKILYMFKRSFNEKVSQAMQMCLRKKKGKTKLTAASTRNQNFIQDVMDHDDGYTVFKNLRSSPSYWKEKTKLVLGMVRQYGKPALFITLSAAESKWPELLVVLMKIVKGRTISESEALELTFEEKAELIRNDPVTCMINFDHRYRALLNKILRPEAGLFSPYTLVDYFSRLEFQMRGSPHSHGLYWIKDAPIFVEGDDGSERACAEFIDKFITCERREDGMMENLIGYQIHKHAQTCQKKEKNGRKKCRFGLPKPPMRETRILTPLPNDFNATMKRKATELWGRIQDDLDNKTRAFKENIPYDVYLETLGTTHEEYILAIRSSIKRTTVYLKRATSAIFVNNYNGKLLEAWGANIDIQFVVDTYACAKYCVGYILKPEGGVSRLLQAATEDVQDGNVGIRDKLRKFANALIHGSEISAQEASAFLLGLQNTFCSRQDVFINTAQPDDRIGMLKPKEELDNLLEDSEDICTKGVIDHYSQRPEELEDMCLAEFASMFEFSKPKRQIPPQDPVTNESVDSDDNGHLLPPKRRRASKPKLTLLDSSRQLTKRTIRKVIRFRHYGKREDPSDYYREQLMLFLPWRNESEELLSQDIDCIKKAEQHSATIFENSRPFYFNREIDDLVLSDLICGLEANAEEYDEYNNPLFDQDMEALDAEYSLEEDGDDMEDVITGSSRAQKFLPPKQIKDEEYIRIMRTLNEKQRRFVLNSIYQLKSSTTPFYNFLSGGAGVGKSHVITAIVQSYLRIFAKVPNTNPEQICVLVSAPTGKAAFNVFGMTLHSTFKLPPNQKGGGLINDLEAGALNTLRLKLIKTKLFIIDEISMTSVRQLYDINQRLKQIFSTPEPFGGRSILVVGHLRQLPPVCGSYVFLPPKHTPLGRLCGNPLWEMFQLYELDEIMRQKGEWEFIKALNNMSEGRMDEEDIALIKSLEITPSRQPPPEAIWLFQTNEECQLRNSAVYAELKTEGTMSTAYDRVQGYGSESQKKNWLELAKTWSQKENDGMPYQTQLQIGGEYFVSTNVDVQDGLFNGSTGSLKKIDYITTPNKMRVPIRAWMDFRNPLIGLAQRGITRRYQIRHHIDLGWVRIRREKRKLTKRWRGLEIIRDQIPLVGANGTTVNKSQGSTIFTVVMNVRKKYKRLDGKIIIKRKLTRELIYVGCSRATTRQGLYIDGDFEAPEMPGPNDPVSIEMSRLRGIPFVFKIKFLQDYGEEFEKIYFHNIQSFIEHHLDVAADQCANASNIIALVEPHLLVNDNFNLPKYRVVYRSNCRGVRNSEGALLLSNETTVLTENDVSMSTDVYTNAHCIFVQWRISDVNVVMIYKSPKYSSVAFLRKLHGVLSSIHGNILVFGDMNINLKDVQGRSLLNVFRCFNMTTRLNIDDASTDGGSHIDCCFSNVDVLNAWYYESYYSYHKPICVVWPKHIE